ncbi:MAG: Na/Pi symporter [Gammaproteobacteria bacterium]|jgi:phosphate:Na+ symporter
MSVWLHLGLQAVGGLGLFLLGMWLLTEGLKLAAGHTLEHVLGTWTRNKKRGFVSGLALTALVQSSSAVTMATIGFVNAGLLTLAQSLWVMFGSNVGTTMTGWLVVLLGFKLEIDAYALPVIGIGALLRIFARGERTRSLGGALAGFGLLFMGIEVLRTAFAAHGPGETLLVPASAGLPDLVLMVAIGMLMTMVMQSSSASMAVLLTAVQGGLLPLEAAAAAVIGANIGTTSTALIASLGATPAAKRVASAHVAFNLITGIVALAILPLFIYVVPALQRLTHEGLDATTTLALFHTLFNLLGVVLMVPLSDPLQRFLLRRFRTAEEDEARPHYLDGNIASMPDLARTALIKELGLVAPMITGLGMQSIHAATRDVHPLNRRRLALDQRLAAISRFSSSASRETLPKEIAVSLEESMRIVQYYLNVTDLCVELAELRVELRTAHETGLKEPMDVWLTALSRLLELNGEPEKYDATAYENLYSTEEQTHDEVKDRLLALAAGAQISAETLSTALRFLSLSRRMGKQMRKAMRHLDALARYQVPEAGNEAA